MRSLLKSLAVVAVLVLLANSCRAQGPGGRSGGLQRPVISPYLNLTTNVDPAVAYYGLVRPQIAFGKAIKNIEGDIDTLENKGPSQTGHSTSFMTQGRYFMTNGASGGAGTGGARANLQAPK